MTLTLTSLKGSISLHAIDLVGSNGVENNVDRNGDDDRKENVNELNKLLLMSVIACDQACSISNLIVKLIGNQLIIIK